jgi:hypothetical protein
MEFGIVGVYQVPEECFASSERPPTSEEWPYMIEVELPESFENVDFGRFTQRVDGAPRSSWQAAKDEQPIAGLNRALFYFHCVQWDKPLITPYGELVLPSPSPIPKRLRELCKYIWD